MPLPVTRPTYTEAISAQPAEQVATSTSTTSYSQERVINAPAVTMTYGYQQSNEPSYAAVNYNNDYQVRGTTSGAYASGVTGVNGVTRTTG